MSDFLDTLKSGDKVVIRNRRLDTFGRRSGPWVYTITKITPKRTRFDLVDKDGQTLELSGKGYGGLSQLLPYTPEIDTEIAQDTALIKAKNRAWRIHELVRTFEQKANDLSPDEISRFLEASKALTVFLAQFEEKKS